MPRKEATALFIGRFQPFHIGHLHLVRSILEDVDRLYVGLGSAQYSHTRANPFTAAERYEMIRRTLEAEGLAGWDILPIPDVGVHSQWVTHILTTVPPFDVVFSHEPLTRRLFHEAGIEVEQKPLLDRDTVSGTEVRRRMLAGQDWTELVPAPVAAYIKEIDGVERIRAVTASEERREEDKHRQG